MMKFTRYRSQTPKNVDQLAARTAKLSLQQPSPENTLRRSQRGRIEKAKSTGSLWSLKSVLRLALPSSSTNIDARSPSPSNHVQNTNGSLLKDGTCTPPNMTQNANGSMIISPQGEEFTPGNMSCRLSLGVGITGGSVPGRRRSTKLLEYPEYATIATEGRRKLQSTSNIAMVNNGFSTIGTDGRRKAKAGSAVGVGRGLQGWRYGASEALNLPTGGAVCGDVASGSVTNVKTLGSVQSLPAGNLYNVTKVSGVRSVTAGSVMKVPMAQNVKSNAGRTPKEKDKIHRYGCMQPASSRSLPLHRYGNQRRSTRNSKRKRRKSRGLLCGVEATSDSPVTSPLRRSPRIAQQPFKHNTSLFNYNAKSEVPDYSFHVPSLEKSRISTTSMLDAVLSTMKRKSIFAQSEDDRVGTQGSGENVVALNEMIDTDTDAEAEQDKFNNANTSGVFEINTSDDEGSEESDNESSLNNTVVEQICSTLPRRKDSFRTAVKSPEVCENDAEQQKKTLSCLDLADIPMIDDDVEEDTVVMTRKSSLRRSKSFAGFCSRRGPSFTKLREIRESPDCSKTKAVRNDSFREAVELTTTTNDTTSMDSGVQLDEATDVEPEETVEEMDNAGENIPKAAPTDPVHKVTPKTPPRRSVRLNDGTSNARSPLAQVTNTTPKAPPQQSKSMVNLQVVKPKGTQIAAKSQSASRLEIKSSSKDEFQLHKRRRHRSVRFSDRPTEILPHADKGTLKRKVSTAALSFKNATLKRSKPFAGGKEEGWVTVDAGRTPKPQRPPASPYQERLIM